MLILGYFLANELPGADLPEEVVYRAQADSAVASLAAHVREQLFRETDDGFELVGESRFLTNTRERAQDGAPYNLLHLAASLRAAIKPNAEDEALLPELLSRTHCTLRSIQLANPLNRAGPYSPVGLPSCTQGTILAPAWRILGWFIAFTTHLDKTVQLDRYLKRRL